MKTRPYLLSLGLCLALSAAAVAQVPPEKALSTFKVVDGLELSLWASEPLFCNPTCIDIDHRGRVWVCESVNYRHTLHGQPPRRPEGDRIVILEDSHGTGHADKATTFYQSPEILAPLGIAVAKDPVGPGYKVFVCQSPDILVFEDKDGDGHADGPPKKLLTGFGGIDHDHGVHGIFIGPDMMLYFSVGDQGVHGLQSSDGKGRKWSSNEEDCAAGTIWRCGLDGRGLELLAHNFRNEYEPCCDSFGTLFVSDNDDDGNQQTRICYVMPGGNYGYHPRGPGQTHWHEEQPGVVPKILRTYFGSPTGMCVYEGTLLPKKYWGQPLHTDAGPAQVRCYHLTPDGAGYAVDREDMVQSSDKWFRPSDVCVAPDGSVYVADWYDPGVGGHGIGDFTRGRIYRLAPPGTKPSVPKVDLESKEGLSAALASPALAVRYMAMAKLQEMPVSAARDVLLPAARQKENPVLRARACWQLVRLKDLTCACDAGSIMSADPDSRFHTLRVRIANDGYKGTADGVVDDADLKSLPVPVARELLLGLRHADPAQVRSRVWQLARRYDGKDRFYLEAVGIAVGHHDKARRDAILADFEKQFPEWNDQVANLVWELRPPQLLPALEKRVADTGLTPAQRTRIAEILAAYQEPEAGKALLHLLAEGASPEVREAVVKMLRVALAGKWRGLRDSQELTASIERLFGQSETRGTAIALIQAAERTREDGRVAGVARDDREPVALRVAAVQTLGAMPTATALATLQGLLQAEPAALRVEAVRALAASRQGTEWLLSAHEKKQLPDGLKGEVARLVRNTPYRDLKTRALAAFPPPGAIDPNKLPDIAVLARRQGNAERGRQLLAASVNSDLQCLKCHTVRGVGGAIGPDLSAIGKKASRENLFESILYPSKAIADQYVTWNVETVAGLSLSGLLVEETADHITLRDANGKDTRVKKSDIDSKTKSPTSLMPGNLVVHLKPDDLVDLVEYLFSLKEEK
jgi:putative membrane-bound dehydrogenase-like protein